jgi:meiotically up-regulated gene 157 (Mug157) protein
MSVQNQPSNMNEAKINNFKFEIQGLGNFAFFVTDCNIPSMTIGEAIQPNHLSTDQFPEIR